MSTFKSIGIINIIEIDNIDLKVNIIDFYLDNSNLIDFYLDNSDLIDFYLYNSDF